MRLSYFVESIRWVGSGIYGLFFSSNPNYQPLSAKPWHEAVLSPNFWLATLQLRLEELAAGIHEGSITQLQQEEACNDLIGLVGTKTIRPWVFLCEVERAIEVVPEKADVISLLSMFLTNSLQADQQWAVACLQAELKTPVSSTDSLLSMLSFYSRVVEAQLFKDAIAELSEFADESLRAGLAKIARQAKYRVSDEGFSTDPLARPSGEALDHGSVTQNTFKSVVSSISQTVNFFLSRPLVAFSGLLLFQSRLVFGATNSNITEYVVDASAGSLQGEAPLQPGVLYGIPPINVYSDPLSLGEAHNITSRAVIVTENANYTLSSFDGQPLPSWIDYETCTDKYLGKITLPQNQYGECVVASTVVNRVAFVAACQNGLFLYDLSDSNDPRLLSQIIDPTRIDANGMIVKPPYLYLGNGRYGFQIYDISNTSDIELIKNFSQEDLKTSSKIDDLALKNGIAFLAGNGIISVNVTVPKNAKVLDSELISKGQAWAIELNDIKESRAYLTEIKFGLVSIFNITDPTNMTLTRNYHEPIGRLYDLEMYKNTLYVATQTNGVQIFKMDDPDLLVMETRYIFNQSQPDPVYDIQIANDVAYLAREKTGMVVISVKDQTNPYFLGGLVFPEARIVSVSAYDDKVAVIDSNFPFLQVVESSLTLLTMRTYPVPDQRKVSSYDLNFYGNFSQADIHIPFTIVVADHPPVFRQSTASIKTTIDEGLEWGLSIYDADNDRISVSFSDVSGDISKNLIAINNDPRVVASYSPIGVNISSFAIEYSINVMYAAMQGAGLGVFDMTSFPNITPLTHPYKPTNGNITQVMFHRYDQSLFALISDEHAGLRVLSIYPNNGSYYGAKFWPISNTKHMAFAADLQTAYVTTWPDSLLAFDLMSEQLGPPIPVPSVRGFGMAIAHGRLYVAGGGQEYPLFYRITLSSSGNPILPAQQVYGPTNETSVILSVMGEQLYVVGNAISVYDVSLPFVTQIQRLGTRRLQQTGRSIVLYPDPPSGKLMGLVSQGLAGVEMLDISDVQNILPVRVYNSRGRTYNVQQLSIHQKTLVVAAGNLGLKFLLPRYDSLYWTHYAIGKFPTGSEGVKQLQLSAATVLSTTKQPLSINILDQAPEKTGAVMPFVNFPAGKTTRHDFASWFVHPGGGELAFEFSFDDNLPLSSLDWLSQVHNENGTGSSILLASPSFKDSDVHIRIVARDRTGSLAHDVFTARVDKPTDERILNYLKENNVLSITGGIVAVLSIIWSAVAFNKKVVNKKLLDSMTELLDKASLNNHGVTPVPKTALEFEQALLECKNLLNRLVEIMPANKKSIVNFMSVLREFNYRSLKYAVALRNYYKTLGEAQFEYASTFWVLLYSAKDEILSRIRIQLREGVHNARLGYSCLLLHDLLFVTLLTVAATSQYTENRRRSCNCCDGKKIQSVPFDAKVELFRAVEQLLSSVPTDDFIDAAISTSKYYRVRALRYLSVCLDIVCCIPDNSINQSWVGDLWDAVKAFAVNILDAKPLTLLLKIQDSIRLKPSFREVNTVAGVVLQLMVSTYSEEYLGDISSIDKRIKEIIHKSPRERAVLDQGTSADGYQSGLSSPNQPAMGRNRYPGNRVAYCCFTTAPKFLASWLCSKPFHMISHEVNGLSWTFHAIEAESYLRLYKDSLAIWQAKVFEYKFLISRGVSAKAAEMCKDGGAIDQAKEDFDKSSLRVVEFTDHLLEKARANNNGISYYQRNIFWGKFSSQCCACERCCSWWKRKCYERRPNMIAVYLDNILKYLKWSSNALQDKPGVCSFFGLVSEMLAYECEAENNASSEAATNATTAPSGSGAGAGVGANHAPSTAQNTTAESSTFSQGSINQTQKLFESRRSGRFFSCFKRSQSQAEQPLLGEGSGSGRPSRGLSSCFRKPQQSDVGSDTHSGASNGGNTPEFHLSTRQMIEHPLFLSLCAQTQFLASKALSHEDVDIPMAFSSDGGFSDAFETSFAPASGGVIESKSSD